MYSFFFQAEDGIRDSSVTGVQTCALPISRIAALALQFERALQVIRSDLAAVQQDFADAHMARRIVAGYGFGIRRKRGSHYCSSILMSPASADVRSALAMICAGIPAESSQEP